MATLVIPECVITKVYESEKSGKKYLTIEDGENTFNIGSGELILKEGEIPTLDKVKIEAEIGSFVYGRNLSLFFKSLNISPVK